MRYISDTTWNEVFDGWRLREASDPGWIECATKTKGWPDWESWRRFTASQVGADQLSWKRYAFTDPMAEIPEMLMGPYSGWQSRVFNKNQSTFVDLINIPEQYEYWSGVRKITSMIEDYPHTAELIGLRRPDNGKLVCFEGHHRATAVAVARKQGKSIDFKGEVSIAIAELPANAAEILEATLRRGSSKNPER